jgi:hypothetical protein
MDDVISRINQAAKLGSAKVAGLVCNKNSPTTLRIELEVPHDQLESVLAALNIEGTDRLTTALEGVTSGLRKAREARESEEQTVADIFKP